MAAPRLAFTWLGHSTFVIDLPNGKRILTDPWLGNPNCPAAFAKPESLKPTDLILVSHGHFDHVGDAAAISRATGAPVIGIYELCAYLGEKGVQDARGMNIGGTQDAAGVRVTLTEAIHSSSIEEDGKARYLGLAAGFVLRAPDMPTIYFAGDTALFSGMKTIGELYTPQIAFLPIGDHYTMGPDAAAIAAQWLNVRQVVPMHWGTFLLLAGRPAALRTLLAPHNIEVLDIEPGQTAR